MFVGSVAAGAERFDGRCGRSGRISRLPKCKKPPTTPVRYRGCIARFHLDLSLQGPIPPCPRRGRDGRAYLYFQPDGSGAVFTGSHAGNSQPRCPSLWRAVGGYSSHHRFYATIVALLLQIVKGCRLFFVKKCRRRPRGTKAARLYLNRRFDRIIPVLFFNYFLFFYIFDLFSKTAKNIL